MKHLVIIIIFFITSLANAQINGINYKALIKDNLGNVVANQNITIQFTVLKGAAQTNVYQQIHTPTTDDNGLIIVTIGGSNDFATIDWGSDEHFLNVQINTGSGLTDMGTTQFRTVPYALNAANVTGLEAIDEGNGIGWRLKGKDPANHGNVGENAVDISTSANASITRGASGDYATAMGSSTTASGFASTAAGFSTTASGNYTTAMGYGTIASGERSTSIGYSARAAAGYSTAIGRYNIGNGNAINWIETDPLLEVGNGMDDANRANALTILKNGTITAPSFDLAEITDDKALITKEYADTYFGGSGLEALDEGNGIGWRLKGQNPANYGNIGNKAVDLSNNPDPSNLLGATGYFSTAMGAGTIASGITSTAIGAGTTAEGFGSIAMGASTTAEGDNSTAMGFGTIASRYASTAMGNQTTAYGENSTAMGEFTRAEGYNSTAMGRYNVGGGNASTWIATDPLFEVGLGASYASRANALTILKNGTITAPSFDLAEITNNKALITKEYLETQVNGLKAIDEGNGLGWRLIGRSVVNYANIGSNAVDLSYSNITSNTFGASGNYATAMGEYTTATGRTSTAMGRYNIGGGNATSWIQTDPLLEVGNGTSITNKSNALTILKNGTITAPSFDLAEITDAKALITKEYADANIPVAASGLETIDEGNSGWRLKGRNPNFYGNIGNNAIDLSYSYIASTTYGATGAFSTAIGTQTTASELYSTAMGNGTTASGNTSTALGTQTIASGFSSTAMGNSTTASGYASTASGYASTASGNNSTAIGFNTTAIGEYTTAIGEYTIATSRSSTTIGRYNIGGGNLTNWVGTDPLFEIGNGIDLSNRNNALTVLKNGFVGFNGTPDTDFHLFHENNGLASGMKLENSSNNAWWRFYVSSGSNDLRLYSTSQGTTIIGAFDDVTGAYTSTSDRRLKKNFKDLHFNWEDFMKLETLTYQYKVKKDSKEYIGLVAQDVEPIYPELVNYNEEEDIYHMDYSGFGVVALKAVQVLKYEVDELKKENAELKDKLNALEQLEARLTALEQVSSITNQIAKQ